MGSKAGEGAKATSLAFLLLDFQHMGVRRYSEEEKMGGQMVDDKKKVQNSFNFKLVCI